MSDLRPGQALLRILLPPKSEVTIPRAQHEALMAAAKQLIVQHQNYYGKSDGSCKACKAIDALRAAGIEDNSNE